VPRGAYSLLLAAGFALEVSLAELFVSALPLSLFAALSPPLDVAPLSALPALVLALSDLLPVPRP
jgi:hypothetical protein